MGLVVVQLGQAGNQLGLSFFNTLASNGLTAQTNADFFRESDQHSGLLARAVLVDMEPKVVAASLRKAGCGSTVPWSYSPHNVVAEESGSGNNWARGFYCHGPKNREAILEAVRVEVEECDEFGGFVTMQSMAGGTGSGLGSYVVEALKDEYPSGCILSNCIWPHESGEVVVQDYNVLLTLSHLEASADAVVVVQNDALSSTCRRALGIHRPCFDNMNHVAMEALACAISPAYTREIEVPAPPPRRRNEKEDYTKPPALGSQMHLLPDLVSHLCAHPSFRMLSIRFAPQVPAKSVEFTTFSWEAELKNVSRWLNKSALREVETGRQGKEEVQPFACTQDRCIANFLVLRGPGSQQASVTAFADPTLYPIWCVDPLAVASHPSKFGKHEMAIALLSNCQSTIVPTIRVLSNAYAMFSSKAYLHRYFEHGMDEGSFDAAFAIGEDLVTRYLTF